MHLLKLRHQPKRAARSWRVTIECERINVDHSLAENPGLKPKLPELFLEAYADARRLAAIETSLPLNTFLDEPPFDIDRLRGLSEDPAAPIGVTG